MALSIVSTFLTNMQNFKYTKDDGETSDRVLHAVGKPGNVYALDLTQYSEEERNRLARLYDEWLENHKKPFDKLAKQFEKDNLKSLSDFYKENGVETPPITKSFKPQGLVEVQ